MAQVQEAPAQPAAIHFVAPDVFHVHGGGITWSYMPTGAGGLAHLSYQDPFRTLSFSGDQIRRVDVPDLGTIVSVTIVMTIDSGSTTFSVLLPQVSLPQQLGASVPMSTDGITTVHRFSIIPALNHGQRELYSVTPLTGTASLVIIPL